jgi:hypothetical protein
MNHPILSFTLTALLSASLGGCDKPGVTEQQKETRANEEAKNAKSEAAQQAQAAQAAAEKDIAGARADFEKAREDYLRARRLDLAELDKRIADLELNTKTNAKTATGKIRTDLEAPLPTIHAQRDAFARHMRDLDTAAAATWDGAKASLDKEWDALKSAVDSAQ